MLVIYVASLVILGSCCNEGPMLGALYTATSGPTWARKNGWSPSGAGYCSFQGVTCSAGCVIALDLRGNQLSGTIPSELGSLTALTILDLSANILSGTIPIQLGSLTALTRFHLDNNQLSGTIPSELGSLTAVSRFDLYSNQLSGTIPSELGRLTSLTGLRVDTNQLSGTIPSELSSLTAARIYAYSNSLCGTIPTSLIPKSARIRLYTNCLDINSDTCSLTWDQGLGSQATCSCLPCTATVNMNCTGSCVVPLPAPYPTPEPIVIPTTTPQPSPAPIVLPRPLPNSLAPLPITAPPIDANTLVESRASFILGDAGYSVLSGPIIAMGGAGLITTNEMCNTMPGRNNRIMMPFPTATPNSYIYNTFLHSGLAVIACIVSYVWLPGSGICWSLFQTAFFGISLNAVQIVSGGLGTFAAIGLVVGLLGVIMYGAILYRLVGQWRTRIECVEVNDTVWLSSMWQGVGPSQEVRGGSRQHGDTPDRFVDEHTTVLASDRHWWSYDDVIDANEIGGEDEEEQEEDEEEFDIVDNGDFF